MKTIKLTVALAIAGLGLGMMASPARAQETVIAKVPFAFVVHGTEMPAGNYEVTADNGILTIRGMDNRSASFAIAMPADGHDPAGDDPSLVFVKYENQNMLSQIWESRTEGLSILQRAGVPMPSRADTRRESSVVLASRLDTNGR
jgi:hypothetical protein